MQGPLIRKNEADINSLIDLMVNNWVNPPSPDESDLVSMSTATMAPPDVVNDLLRAFDVRAEANQTFKRTTLDVRPQSLKLYDKMTQQRMKTFSSMSTTIFQMTGQKVAPGKTETSLAKCTR